MEGVQINYTDLSDLFWEYKRKIENSVELLLENLQSCLSKIGLSQGAIESYETGSFITDKDAAADELAKRIGGQSRSAFADDPIQREFDVISDQYIAQAKPPLKCVNKTVRTQMKATFEAAKKYERKVYYQFEGIPSQEVLDKLYEYSERYGVEVIIDTEPLGILN